MDAPSRSDNNSEDNSKRGTMRSNVEVNRSRLSERKQFSSFLLFLSAVVLVNLCPLHDQQQPQDAQPAATSNLDLHYNNANHRNQQQLQLQPTLNLENCLQFVQLMFTNPIRLGKRTTRVTLAEAKVLGKMAKVWYIKKKIKKFGKKLKKHTIAVPVFTAIPIYEHSYYPHHHMGGGGGGDHHHHAAASAYAPATILAPTAAASSTSSQVTVAAAANQQQQQQLATSASNHHHQMAAYRPPPSMFQHQHQHQPAPSPSHHHIINAYAPAPPLYVDESGGLYGTYGNAYGRYDGGYQYW